MPKLDAAHTYRFTFEGPVGWLIEIRLPERFTWHQHLCGSMPFDDTCTYDRFTYFLYKFYAGDFPDRKLVGSGRADTTGVFHCGTAARIRVADTRPNPVVVAVRTARQQTLTTGRLLVAPLLAFARAFALRRVDK